MAVVLNEKYRPGPSTYSLFTSNRFLRLFPVYAMVVCLPARCIGGRQTDSRAKSGRPNG